MKLTKTQWIIVAVAAGVAIWYFFLRKKEETKESGYAKIPAKGEFGNKTIFRKDQPLFSNYVSSEIDAGIIESGYDADEFPGIESGYEKMRSAVSTTKPTTLYNQGQMCRKDNQCQGGLKCINGKCSPVKSSTPIVPIKSPIKPIITTQPATLSDAMGISLAETSFAM